MTRHAATQCEIVRAIKAAKLAGLEVNRVEVDGTKIVVLTTQERKEPDLTPGQQWQRKRDAREA